MFIKLSIVSVFLLALSASARPAFDPLAKKDTKSAHVTVYAKRQTTRQEISYRSHLKENVKLVAKNPVPAQLGPSTPKLAARAPAPSVDRRSFPFQYAADQLEERVTKLEARAPEPSPVPARRSIPLSLGESTLEKRRATNIEQNVVSVNDAVPEFGTYPKCGATVSTGYAHYPGWKLFGDDLSGAVPIVSESSCILACDKYGGSCAGVFFDANIKKCFLKSTHTSAWSFYKTDDAEDGTNLIGGCAMWSDSVPPEMDAVCCRD